MIQGQIPKNLKEYKISAPKSKLLMKNNHQAPNLQSKNSKQVTSPSQKNHTQEQKNKHQSYFQECLGIVCSIFQDEMDEVKGMGVLISHNIVLTCAHLFYKRQSKKKAATLKFSLKRQQKIEEYQIKRTFYNKRFLSEDNQQAQLWDFALIELDRLYIAQTKFIKLKPSVKTKVLHLYSNISLASNNKQADQAHNFQKIKLSTIEYEQKFIKYQIQKRDYQINSSPILRQNFQGEGQYQIVGISICDIFGRLIEKQMMQQLLEWTELIQKPAWQHLSNFYQNENNSQEYQNSSEPPDKMIQEQWNHLTELCISNIGIKILNGRQLLEKKVFTYAQDDQ